MRIHDRIRCRKNKIKCNFMNLNIKRKMQISFISLSILPLIILGIYSYSQNLKLIEDIASRHATNIISETEISLKSQLDEINNLSKILKSNKSIINILSKTEREFEEEREFDIAQVRIKLNPFLLNSDYIENITIMAENHNTIFTTSNDKKWRYRKVLDSYKTSQIYSNTRDSYNNHEWWTTNDINGEKGTFLARKIYASNYDLLGIILMEVSEDIMGKSYRYINDFENSELFLLDNKNEVIYSKGDLFQGELPPGDYFEQINKKNKRQFDIRGTNVTYSIQREKLLLSYKRLLHPDWKLVIFIPYSDLSGGMFSIVIVALLFSLIIGILVIITSIILASGIYKPLQKLMGLMEQGSKGNIKVRYDVQYEDDIGELGMSFNKLMADTEDLIEKLKHEQEEKTRAQMEVLEAQIDSHFLYNTFATMYWTAMEEGNYKLAQMTNSLSNYFKLGLNQGKELTTVEKEVRHVEEYLKIQQIRFNENFSYEINIEERVKDKHTIKLLLQTLAENSIMHGFNQPGIKKYYIKIKAVQAGNRILYTVEDNGKGIKYLQDKGLEHIMSQGFGLKNIDKRLSLFYKEDYTFKCESTPEVKTIFEISVPII